MDQQERETMWRTIRRERTCKSVRKGTSRRKGTCGTVRNRTERKFYTTYPGGIPVG